MHTFQLEMQVKCTKTADFHSNVSIFGIHEETSLEAKKEYQNQSGYLLVSGPLFRVQFCVGKKSSVLFLPCLQRSQSIDGLGRSKLSSKSHLVDSLQRSHFIDGLERNQWSWKKLVAR